MSSHEHRRWHTPIAHRLFAETLIVLRHESSTVIERDGLVAIWSGCHKRIGCRTCIGWRRWIGRRLRTPDQGNTEYGQNDAGSELRRTALHLSPPGRLVVNSRRHAAARVAAYSLIAVSILIRLPRSGLYSMIGKFSPVYMTGGGRTVWGVAAFAWPSKLCTKTSSHTVHLTLLTACSAMRRAPNSSVTVPGSASLPAAA